VAKDGPMGNLPKAHTCFNRLDLPKFSSKEDMQIALDYIANNEILGFGIDE
jgi:E3 ubiquitin-protein ligase NEDD4